VHPRLRRRHHEEPHPGDQVLRHPRGRSLAGGVTKNS